MEAVEAHLLASLRGLESPAGVPHHAAPEAPLPSAPSLTGAQALSLFDAQLASRHLDVAAHWLRSKDAGYYTIGSSGHEGNAAVAAALRPTDPALLHYRSGAFYVSRGWQVPGHDPVRDVLLGLCAAAEDPISGGRHKVFGHPDLAVLPQTSTIASHLPRAVGMAFAVERSRKLGLSSPWPDDAVVVAGAGDASINHSTFVGALNTAGWVVQSGLALPLLVVVEDNGMGISVPSPPGWVAAALSGRPHLRYFAADGCDVTAVHEVATRGGRPCTPHASPRSAPPRPGAADGSRGQRRRDGVPHASTGRRRPRTRPAAGHRAPPRGGGPADAGRGRRTLRGRTRVGPGSGGRARRFRSPGRRRDGDAAVATARCLGRRRGSGAGGVGAGSGSGVRVLAARVGRRADSGAGDQRHPAGRRRGPAGGRGVRRGREPQGWRLRRDPRAAPRAGRRPGVRHAPRRAGDPRTRARVRGERDDPGAGDPVPRLPAQRRGPAPGRGCDAAVLLRRGLPQPDGRAHRVVRRPGRIRRTLPQRLGARRAPRRARAW